VWIAAQAVDDGGEHAHVVAGGAVNPAFFHARDSAENVAAADDDRDLHAQGADLLDLLRNGKQHIGVEALGLPLVLQHLAAELQENAFVFRFRGRVLPRHVNSKMKYEGVRGAMIGGIPPATQQMIRARACFQLADRMTPVRYFPPHSD
jgi:hypothetical protein